MYPYEGTNGNQQLVKARVSATSHHHHILNNVFRDFHYADYPDHDQGDRCLPSL